MAVTLRNFLKEETARLETLGFPSPATRKQGMQLLNQRYSWEKALELETFIAQEHTLGVIYQVAIGMCYSDSSYVNVNAWPAAPAADSNNENNLSSIYAFMEEQQKQILTTGNALGLKCKLCGHSDFLYSFKATRSCDEAETQFASCRNCPGASIRIDA